MCNHHLRNKNLSLKAKGLLSQVLSLPDGWNFTFEGLCSLNKEGKEAMQSAIKELRENGYLTKDRIRNEKGQITDVEYVFHEFPVDGETVCRKTRQTDNPPLLNTDSILSTDSIKYSPLSKERPPKGEPTPKRERKRFTPPKLEEVEAYCRERQNGIDASKFIDYYESVGWKVGKQAMKDWKAAVRTWERRDASNASSQAKKEETYRAPVFVGYDEEGRGIYK
nr:MAG TPA: Dna polymerase B [Caudoviricetes sp.]